MGCLFPQPIGHPRPLPRSATGSLRRSRLRGAVGDEPRHPGGLVKLCPARQAGIDYNRNTIQRQRCLSDRRGQHDAAAAIWIAADCGALCGRFALPMQRQDRHVGQALHQPVTGSLDLPDTWQEGQNVTFLVTPCRKDRAGHGFIQPQFRTRTQPADRQRPGLAFAFDHRRASQQTGEACTVKRCRHHHQPQVFN